MARLTKEQKNFGEAMRLLIELYYKFEETDRKDWYSNEIIVLISKVFALVFPNFRPCIYYQRLKMFRYGLPDDEIRVKRSDIEIFIAIMKTIRTDISSGRVNLFQIKERVVSNQCTSQIRPSSVAAKKITSRQTGLESLKPVTIISQHNIRTGYKYRGISLMPPNPSQVEYDNYHLSGNRPSSLVEELFRDIGTKIWHPKFFSSSSSFKDVIRYLLVKYQYIFGSYERIKLCCQCGKLFFERKLGAGFYCSGTCRKRYYDALQPKGKRLCRERQNAWIRYRQLFHNWPRVFTLQRDDCLNCSETVESGKCPALIRKNKHVIEKIIV